MTSAPELDAFVQELFSEPEDEAEDELDAEEEEEQCESEGDQTACSVAMLSSRSDLRRGEWSEAEVLRLRQALLSVTGSFAPLGPAPWSRVAALVGTRSQQQCSRKWDELLPGLLRYVDRDGRPIDTVVFARNLVRSLQGLEVRNNTTWLQFRMSTADWQAANVFWSGRLNRLKWEQLVSILPAAVRSQSVLQQVELVAQSLQCDAHRKEDHRLLRRAVLELDAEAAALAADEEEPEAEPREAAPPLADQASQAAPRAAPRPPRPDFDNTDLTLVEFVDKDGQQHLLELVRGRIRYSVDGRLRLKDVARVIRQNVTELEIADADARRKVWRCELQRTARAKVVVPQIDLLLRKREVEDVGNAKSEEAPRPRGRPRGRGKPLTHTSTAAFRSQVLRKMKLHSATQNVKERIRRAMQQKDSASVRRLSLELKQLQRHDVVQKEIQKSLSRRERQHGGGPAPPLLGPAAQSGREAPPLAGGSPRHAGRNRNGAG